MEYIYIYGLIASSFVIYFLIFHLWFEGIYMGIKDIKLHLHTLDNISNPKKTVVDEPKDYFKKMGWDKNYIIRKKSNVKPGPKAGQKYKKKS